MEKMVHPVNALAKNLPENHAHVQNYVPAAKNRSWLMLPQTIRQAGFDRMQQLATKLKIKLHICSCKNSDLANETCYITRDMETNLLNI